MSRLGNRGWGDYWYCTAKNRDGSPCGRKVGTSRSLCWQHRKQAEKARRSR